MKKWLVPVTGLLLLVLGLVASPQSPPLREIAAEFPVELELILVEERRAPVLLLDDFEDSALTSAFGGAYECGASYDDTAAACEISWSPDGPSSGYLAFEYVHRSWMKLGLGGFPRPIDASGREGIEVVVWSNSDIGVQLEIGTRDRQDIAAAYVSPRFPVSRTPRTFRIPFADLIPYGSGRAGIPEDRLVRVHSISFFPDAAEGTLYVDNLGLYSPVQAEAPPTAQKLVGRIIRYASVGTVPFSVRYEAEFPDQEGLTYTWTTDPGEETDGPARLYVVPDVAAVEYLGNSQTFIVQSNANLFSIVLSIEDSEERRYEWEDPGVDLPLHNHTEITLDATRFVPEAEIESVRWTAGNGDPADAVTFPIADPTATVTTLVSEWPNVLTISCEITTHDGSTLSESAEALIYFRDGTPFEIRSIASTQHMPMLRTQLDEILDQEFALLRSLGANAITTAINWYFGPPDATGSWSIHPIWLSRTAPHDPRGYTVLDEDFEALVTSAHENGFKVHVQMTQTPYTNDPDIEWDRTTYDFTPRATDGFLYGNGEGYENMLLYYLDEFIQLGVEFVFLGAENSGAERLGGAALRGFYESVIQQYRDAGFTGGISYASNFAGEFEYERELLIPEASGIPYKSMDAVSSTYYPYLASREGASTVEMRRWVREDTEEFFKPRTEIYNLPTIIEDCYCFAYADCAVNPIEHGDKPREAECSRRYFNAILREFAAANLSTDTPWVQGMTIGEYKILADKYVRDFYQDGIVAYPWLNESAGRVELQLAIKVFYSDKPLLAEGE